MKRRVIKQGNDTLTITLPRDWTKRFGIKPGEELEIAEDGANLVIAKELVNTKGRKVVNLEKPRRLVFRILFNLYRLGYDEIEARFDDPKLIPDIKEAVSLMMGFDIIDQSKNHCILKNIAKIDESEYDSVFKRMFLILLSVAEDVHVALKNQDYETLDTVMEMEDTLNKLFLFCSKSVNKAPSKFKVPTMNYVLLHQIEEIMDMYKYICKYVKQNKLKPGKEIVDYMKDLSDLLKDLYNLYYKFDYGNMKKIILKRDELFFDKGEILLKEANKKEVHLVHLANEIVFRIFNASSPIFGIKG